MASARWGRGIWAALAAVALAAPPGLAADPTVVVLFEKKRPDFAPDLGPRGAKLICLDGFRNSGIQADTVVLGGHSSPPMYVGQPAVRTAKAIASFHPQLVILDTCYGASTPILNALAAEGLRSWVVAAPYQLLVRNFRYGADVFRSADPVKRAMAVQTTPPYPLLRWKLDPAALRAIEAKVDAMGPQELERRLKCVRPALVRMALPTRESPQGRILVPVPIARFK